jgi:hypothetical protein
VPDTIGDVIDDLRGIEQRLPPGDGVRTFTRVYREVTQRLALRLHQPGRFTDPLFVERLDVVFAQLFLDAEASAADQRPVPHAWEPLMAARATPGVLPIQHALAGMNAHINHDLAIAVLRTCQETNRPPTERAVALDYAAVTDVLAEVVRAIRQSFLHRVAVQVGSPLSTVADAVSVWSIDKARDAAWTMSRTVWEIRALPPLVAAFSQTLGRTVGAISRPLLMPLGAGAAVTEDDAVERLLAAVPPGG